MRQVFLCFICFIAVFSYYLSKNMRPLQTRVDDLSIQVHLDDQQTVLTMPAYSQIKDLIAYLELDPKEYETRHLNLNDYLEESVVYTFRKKESLCIAINQADLKQLQMLPGVGKKTAEAILRYREENGPFKRVEDLLNVKGIGEKKLAKMREDLCL